MNYLTRQLNALTNGIVATGKMWASGLREAFAPDTSQIQFIDEELQPGDWYITPELDNDDIYQVYEIDEKYVYNTITFEGARGTHPIELCQKINKS